MELRLLSAKKDFECLPSFTYLPTDHLTTYPLHTDRHRVCTLTNEKPRGVLRKPLLPKYITLSMQSVERATGMAHVVVYVGAVLPWDLSLYTIFITRGDS